jgi:predicted alpha/beta-fold hydrolase
MSSLTEHFLSGYRPFVPRRGLSSGHAMTLFTWARRRAFPALPPPEARLVRVSPDTQVLAHCYWQPNRSGCSTVLVLHGLEGSSEAHYMRGLATKAWQRGWNAVLLNQRNCGGTEHLTPGLYHSGLTDDPRSVIRALAHTDGLREIGVIGYSLGGNLTIKLAGELAASPDLPVAAVVAISPTIDLDLCVRALERRANIAYHFNFVRHLKARMRRKAVAWPDAFDLRPLGSIWTIRKFDDVYTAPSHGFDGASDYYFRASALRTIDQIRIPALILTAENDPFVPVSQFRGASLRDNPHVAVCVERHGGHCGFAGLAADDDGYWAETTALNFLGSVMSPSGHAP